MYIYLDANQFGCRRNSVDESAAWTMLNPSHGVITMESFAGYEGALLASARLMAFRAASRKVTNAMV